MSPVEESEGKRLIGPRGRFGRKGVLCECERRNCCEVQRPGLDPVGKRVDNAPGIGVGILEEGEILMWSSGSGGAGG